MNFKELVSMSKDNPVQAHMLGLSLFATPDSIAQLGEAIACLELFSVCDVERTETQIHFFAFKGIEYAVMLSTAGLCVKNGHFKSLHLTEETCSCGNQRFRFTVALSDSAARDSGKRASA